MMVERFRPINRYRPDNQHFEVGDRVYDVSAPQTFGTCVKKGPEVAEVRWEEGSFGPYVSNSHLRRAKQQSKRGRE